MQAVGLSEPASVMHRRQVNAAVQPPQMLGRFGPIPDSLGWDQSHHVVVHSAPKQQADFI
jgi:hypothetical protein